MALIEREALKICKHGNGYGYCFLHEEYCPEGPCKEEELVEYTPVVHGWWENVETTAYGLCYATCSECQIRCARDTVMGIVSERFCKDCGARMDGGDGHEAD